MNKVLIISIKNTTTRIDNTIAILYDIWRVLLCMAKQEQKL